MVTQVEERTICEYCDSYSITTEKGTCICCGAPKKPKSMRGNASATSYVLPSGYSNYTVMASGAYIYPPNYEIGQSTVVVKTIAGYYMGEPIYVGDSRLEDMRKDSTFFSTI